MNEAAADSYEANLPAHIIRADIRTVDPHSLAPVDLLWASPVCTMFSQARDPNLPSDGTEDLGLACIPFLEVLKPPVFILENVTHYGGSVPFLAVVAALWRLGYIVAWSNCNSADFGVPQTRNRLILRATRLGLLPPLPEPVPWVGWFSAIEDLLPALPESAFARWQLERLKNHPLVGDFLLMTGNTQIANPTGTGMLQPDVPANTVHRGSTTARAFLLSGAANPTLRDAPEPAFTMTANIGETTVPRAFLVHPTADNERFVCREETEPSFTVKKGVNMPRAFLLSNAATEWGDGLRLPEPPANAVTSQSVGRTRAFLVSGTSDCGVRESNQPASTVVANRGDKAALDRAFLVDGQSNKQGTTLTDREGGSPAFTVSTTATHRPGRAQIPGGRVVQLTVHALARFQSMPDSYQHSTRRTVATSVIGNGVPCLMAQRLAEPFIRMLEETA